MSTALFSSAGPDVQTFLRDYWQRRPLVLKRALPDFRDPLSPEELAGLACEESVESRLVFQRGGRWSLRHGPFEESDFTSLPERDWTLLVQGVDQWLPEVRALLRLVDFLPRWRVDDVMVSYAEPDGGVGPHFDYYDVFILQGAGSRLWRIGQRCDSRTPLDTSSGMKILESFEPREEWLLEAGDVLYIPPGVAHYGTAVDAGLSYSIGFRAPSLAEALTGFSDELCAGVEEDRRYRDPLPAGAARPGEIPPDALASLETLVQEALRDRQALARWFGRHVSEPRTTEFLAPPEQPLDGEDLRQALAGRLELRVNPASRLCWLEAEDGIELFADGESLPIDDDKAHARQLAVLLCGTQAEAALDLAPFLSRPRCLDLLARLYNQGSLIQEKE